MRHRTVHDVMTREVVTVRADTPVKEIVGLLHRNDITAVPVIDDRGRPLGVVSEADLLRKQTVLAGQGTPATGRPLGWDERARAEAETAGGLMTNPAVTARPEWSIPEAARAMEERHVKRLPVVDDADRLVGIVGRRDLLRIFLRHDPAIREEIVQEVLGVTLRLSDKDVRVAVHDGVVTLTGRVPFKSLVPIVERLCRSVDGVVAVHHHFDVDVDDTQNELEHPQAHINGPQV